MQDKKAVVFLSHKCSSKMHELLEKVSHDLTTEGFEPVVDPFGPGDRTARRTQEEIKRSTHFVFFAPPEALSRWLRVELAFASKCEKRAALRLLPIGSAPELSSNHIRLNVDWGASADEISSAIVEAVKSKQPTNALGTDYDLSERLKELGRKIERTSSKFRDPSLLHDAIESYDSAIQLDLSNAAAWANKAWCLFKLHEDARAKRQIEVATAIDPDSSHIQDVATRISANQRTIR